MTTIHRLPRVFLTKNLRQAILSGHPWVFSDALRVPKGTPGGWADLYESGPKGRFLARGIFDPESAIVFRVLTTSPEQATDAALIQQRVEEAQKLRERFLDLKATNAYRLLHGEGDFLPGVICDRYDEVAVVRYDSEVARRLYAPVLEPFLSRGLGIKTVFVRAGRRGEGVQGETRIGPEPPEEIVILEEGIRFGVNVRRGQKTGFFLDQRENRGLVRRLARGRRVLNCFCYTGGFTVAAALGGATETTSIDSAAPAVEEVRRNLARNGVDPDRHTILAEDAFAFLARSAREGRVYDLVILDPPSFAPSERTRKKALLAYRELNVLGLAVLAEGGILCTASCSSHISQKDFLDVLRDAFAQGRRALRVVEIRGAGPDHPVLPAFPEGRYLKFVVAS